ncbi:MAG: hypothetical protein LBT30_05110 [Clostridiales bacterium]|jgi:hypothetical protein|nr:hypothetical protein [Clostridiales bacterium]
MKKKMIYLLLIITAVVLTACSVTDVIANYAVKSFKDLSAELGEARYQYDSGQHTLISPNGKEKFLWGERLAIEVDLSEFISAGLDVAKLTDFDVNGNILAIELENAKTVTETEKFSALKKTVRTNRNALGFDEDMGHFGLSFGNEFAFEWAQHLDKNDKDMVFLLNPMPFIEAGLITEQLENWVYTKLKMMKDGKEYEAFMLVRFYDLI